MPGRIVPEDVAELRDRSDLSEIASGHMQLRKAGRVLKGLCCFHQEKTPSFTLDPEKQLYYCHGCGAGGDVFSFLQKAEGLNFAEAAQRLADRFGVNLRFEQNFDKSGGSRRSLLAAVDSASRYFTELLATGKEAAAARKYLESRGFSAEDAATWGIGFSPAGTDVLYRRLLAQKFSSSQIVEAGLALVTDSGEHRDRFRRRVMFPVSELTGQVVGFGARALGEEQPKYLNSPETALYRKAKILFGLDRAKAKMVSNGSAIVTEGYTDVIALHKIGFTNAVATCGTALGEEHFALIKRFCERVILAFDADAAGAVASERGFGIHSKVGLEVLVAPIPAGKDPADVALAEGEEAFGLIVDQAVPLMRFVLDQEIARHNLQTAEGKSRAVRAAAALLAWEPNRVARSEHGFWVARRIGVASEQVQLEIAEVDQPGRDRSSVPKAMRMPGHVKVEREALALLLTSPSLLKLLISGEGTEPGLPPAVNEDHFTQPSHRVLFSTLVEVARERQRIAAGGGSGGGESGEISPSQLEAGGESGEISPSQLEAGGESGGVPPTVMDWLPDDETRRLAAELALTPTVTKDQEEVFVRLEVFRVERQIEAARAKLNRLDAVTDVQEYDELFEELMRLDAQRRRFEDQ